MSSGAFFFCPNLCKQSAERPEVTVTVEPSVCGLVRGEGGIVCPLFPAPDEPTYMISSMLPLCARLYAGASRLCRCTSRNMLFSGSGPEHTSGTCPRAAAHVFLHISGLTAGILLCDSQWLDVCETAVARRTCVTLKRKKKKKREAANVQTVRQKQQRSFPLKRFCFAATVKI